MKVHGNELVNSVNSLSELKERISKVFELQEKIISLLINNEGKWNINENEAVAFDESKTLNEYNKYLEELQNALK